MISVIKGFNQVPRIRRSKLILDKSILFYFLMNLDIIDGGA